MVTAGDSIIELNKIYKQDCLEFMKNLKTQKLNVDVIVTSPPYNINKEYGSYDDKRSREDYLFWLENIANESISILKDGGSFFLNIAGRPTDPELPFCVLRRFIRSGYKLQNTIHWIKSISFDPEDIGKNNTLRGDNFANVSIGHFKPIISDRYLSDLQEYIFQFTKTGGVKLDKLKAGVTYQDKTNIGRWKSAVEDKRDRGNVWFIPYPTIQEGRPHPAIFPVKLPERCIMLHGIKKNMLIYDPFIGIGTTALACIHLKINYIGTEIDPQYIKIAQERISGDIEAYLSKDDSDLT